MFSTKTCWYHREISSRIQWIKFRSKSMTVRVLGRITFSVLCSPPGEVLRELVVKAELNIFRNIVKEVLQGLRHRSHESIPYSFLQ